MDVPRAVVVVRSGVPDEEPTAGASVPKLSPRCRDDVSLADSKEPASWTVERVRLVVREVDPAPPSWCPEPVWELPATARLRPAPDAGAPPDPPEVVPRAAPAPADRAGPPPPDRAAEPDEEGAELARPPADAPPADRALPAEAAPEAPLPA